MVELSDNTKVCSICKRDLPLAEFYEDRYHHTHQGRCKKCATEQYKDYYKKVGHARCKRCNIRLDKYGTYCPECSKVILREFKARYYSKTGKLPSLQDCVRVLVPSIDVRMTLAGKPATSMGDD